MTFFTRQDSVCLIFNLHKILTPHARIRAGMENRVMR
jgi:hypothetical protein